MSFAYKSRNLEMARRVQQPADWWEIPAGVGRGAPVFRQTGGKQAKNTQITGK